MIGCMVKRRFFFFFFNDTATTEIYTLTLHDALPISIKEGAAQIVIGTHALIQRGVEFRDLSLVVVDEQHRFGVAQDRKSTRLNSSHANISYAVFCLKKKKKMDCCNGNQIQRYCAEPR